MIFPNSIPHRSGGTNHNEGIGLKGSAVLQLGWKTQKMALGLETAQTRFTWKDITTHPFPL